MKVPKDRDQGNNRWMWYVGGFILLALIVVIFYPPVRAMVMGTLFASTSGKLLKAGRSWGGEGLSYRAHHL